MPEKGVDLSPKDQLLTTSEILRLSSIFVDQGVTKIRLTGGEPTLRKDLIDILKGLNDLRSKGLETIGMTTNAIALERKLPQLHSHGLNQLNISLDTLDPFKFQLLTRRNGLEKVLKSMETALSMSFEAVKLNVVVIQNVNEDEVDRFVGKLYSF
jgi:cyclic pyranopterin phosphate synthase